MATDDAVVIGPGSTTGTGMFAAVTATTRTDWASLLPSLRFWNYSVEGEDVTLEVMGEETRFPLSDS